MPATTHTVATNKQLAELLTNNSIEKFSVDTDTFPSVAVIEGNRLVTLIPYDIFQPEDWMGDIRRIMDWHTTAVDRGLHAGDYATLVKGRSKLAAAMEYLGQYKAQCDAAYTEAGYLRRRKRDALILIYRKSEPASVAEAKARTETKEYDDEHTASQKTKVEVQTLYDTVKETLNAMAGEIAMLKRELQFAGIASG